MLSGSATQSSMPHDASEASRNPQRDPSLDTRKVERFFDNPLRVTTC